MKHSKVLEQKAPEAQFRSQVSVLVCSSPEEALDAFESVTPRDMPLARFLGELRYLPGRLIGKKPPHADPDLPFGKQLRDMGTREIFRSPVEIVTGAAGKLHQISDQEFVKFSSNEELDRFRQPEYQKLYISVRAEEIELGKSELTLEHWTWALSENSKRKFAKYWIVIRPMGNFVSKILLNAAKRKVEEKDKEYAVY